MTSGWVAGSVRARAMARRRLGAGSVLALAASPSLTDALETLAGTPYGHDVRPGQSLAEAQHAVGATLLWNIRVLAGWLPAEGVVALRALAGWFELMNVEGHLEQLAGRGSAPAYRLGTLATAWPRLSRTAAPREVREVLATSPWGDPGADTHERIQLAMRVAYAERVAVSLPQTAGWAAAAVTLLLARERFLAGRSLPEPVPEGVAALVGGRAAEASSLQHLRAALRGGARWVLAAVQEPADLWRAEFGWWRVVESDAFRLMRRARFGPDVVCGAVALLAVDAWRVSAALETAARGGPSAGAFDVVA